MMSPPHIVQEVYKKLSSGDFEGFLDLCDDAIEWVVNGPETLEKCQAFQGKNGVRHFLDILGSTWYVSSFDVKSIVNENNTVVVLGEETGRHTDSEIFFENRWAHVFDVKDGKIVRFREFLCHWPGVQKPPEMTWDEK
ncbi:MAG: nuclear transport factor 2 family protein [Candidatus Electrothrix aestuarii]|uniref:Nuclear transport factor 2 family protein n=1 Tax=Candidatus Electrothrix aestuarii TaxID=3062594 RepID=A0AAU8LSI6_9BACT|nr:nuclear transport factor 2 family protein [Candidatus Electrothrix aestuarii]WPD21474.1 MAG: nuclear transport factor 2 family protein [Candidatus Electrothrix sp. GW3-3]